MGASERTKKILFIRAGGVCCFLGCEQELVPITAGEQEPFLGQAAHIKGEKPGSARYDEEARESERNSVDNLIALCPTHHKLIDDIPVKFTVEKLKNIKKEREEWVRDQIKRKMTSITFEELPPITKYLTENTEEISDIKAIHPKEKIKKNELSENTESLIIIGMARQNLVKNFIEKHPDPAFGERLKQGFVKRYTQLKEEKLKGDELFDALFESVCQRKSDFKFRAAALTVMCYFFEKCDIFEK